MAPGSIMAIHHGTLNMTPTTVPIPTFGDKEALEQALLDIVHIIKNQAKTNVPQYWKGDAIHAAF
eukprot:13418371-Ditylum_brightwellii.AAC.1